MQGILLGSKGTNALRWCVFEWVCTYYRKCDYILLCTEKCAQQSWKLPGKWFQVKSWNPVAVAAAVETLTNGIVKVRLYITLYNIQQVHRKTDNRAISNKKNVSQSQSKWVHLRSDGSVMDHFPEFEFNPSISIYLDLGTTRDNRNCNHTFLHAFTGLFHTILY